MHRCARAIKRGVRSSGFFFHGGYKAECSDNRPCRPKAYRRRLQPSTNERSHRKQPCNVGGTFHKRAEYIYRLALAIPVQLTAATGRDLGALRCGDRRRARRAQPGLAADPADVPRLPAQVSSATRCALFGVDLESRRDVACHAVIQPMGADGRRWMWLAPPTSAPGLGPSCHICTGTGLTPSTSAPGQGLVCTQGSHRPHDASSMARCPPWRRSAHRRLPMGPPYLPPRTHMHAH